MYKRQALPFPWEPYVREALLRVIHDDAFDHIGGVLTGVAAALHVAEGLCPGENLDRVLTGSEQGAERLCVTVSYTHLASGGNQAE